MKVESIYDPERVLTEPVRRALERARVTLLLRHAMAGVFLARCRWVVTTKHPTAGVDGRRFWVNPAFFLGLSAEDRVFVLLHEALHLALGHHLRAGKRDSKLWNWACDYVVNASILEGGYRTLPEGALYEPRYARSSAEQVYADLARQEDRKPPASSSGPSGGSSDSPADSSGSPEAPSDPLTKASGDLPPTGAPATPHGDVLPCRNEDGSELSHAEQRRMETEHTLLLQQVAMTCGSGTPTVTRELASRRAPTADFRDMLLRFVSEIAARGDDYAFSRRNRRYMATLPYVILPGSISRRLGRVIAVIDTSGSIGREEVGRFTGALEEMLQAFPGVDLTVAAADDRVHEIHEIPTGTSTFPEDLPLSGHGGTDFRPAIAWAEEQVLPDLLVYLTDGFGEAPERPPAFPVLWALPDSRWSRPPAPWGVVARLAA